MKKLVVTIDAYHDNAVAEQVDRLQKIGFEVIDIQRKKKMFLGTFGKDVTEITYIKQKK